MGINPNGDVNACTAPIGNVYKSSIIEIIKNYDPYQQPRPEGRGMLFSKGGYTQGFNTFLTAMNGGVLNPIGTNKKFYTRMLAEGGVKKLYEYVTDLGMVIDKSGCYSPCALCGKILKQINGQEGGTVENI